MNNYTIVLAHGIARFDFLTQRFSKDLSVLGFNPGLANNELHYFKGISRHLRNNSFNTYPSSVEFAASLKKRAEDLQGEVEKALSLRPEQPKVHIIAHSMGGLDARYMIAKLGMENKVASLTTIGTPHLGTSFADWGMENEGDEILKVLDNVLNLDGFSDLTTAACTAFNDSVRTLEAANSVFYQTYSAVEEQKKVFAPLQLSWQIIHDAEGENDGLVSRKSQQWDTELIAENGTRKTIRQRDFPISADHLNEVGWWDMNQFELSDLFHTDLLSSVGSYENKIKNVYLEIAQSVQNLP